MHAAPRSHSGDPLRPNLTETGFPGMLPDEWLEQQFKSELRHAMHVQTILLTAFVTSSTAVTLGIALRVWPDWIIHAIGEGSVRVSINVALSIPFLAFVCLQVHSYRNPRCPECRARIGMLQPGRCPTCEAIFR